MIKKRLPRILVALLLTAAMLVGCATGPSESYPLQIKLQKYSKPVQTHTELQLSYLNDKDVSNIKAYAKGDQDLSSPLPVKLGWDTVGDIAVQNYKVTLYLDKDLTNVARTMETKVRQVDVYNLLAGTQYWWTVEALSGSDVIGKATGSFKTDATLPRNIQIDGLTNCRDAGGWKTQDGGYVRQGMLYRTAKLNKNNMVKVTPLITEKGIVMMKDVLGMKTELDLRREGSNEVGGLTDTSVLGEGVNYVCAEMMNTFPIIQPLSYPGIVEAFEVLADEDNYPVFFHCSIGTDRTGAISFFVLNLCGVAEKDIYRDYLFSNFGNIGSERTARQLQVYFDTIQPFEGKNWTEKTRSFLLSIGVTNEQMDSVVRIMKVK